MKFINLLPINDSPQIEICKDELIWDLHNVASFTGYDFDKEKHRLILSWDYGCDCEKYSPGKIKLILSGLKKCIISKKDSEVPRSEDSCLEYLRLEGNEMIEIHFRGGQSFQINCDTVEFDPGNSIGHLAQPVIQAER